MGDVSNSRASQKSGGAGSEEERKKRSVRSARRRPLFAARIKKKKKKKSRDSLPFPSRNRDTVYIRCNIMYFIVGTFSSLSGRVLEFLESLSVFCYARENIAGLYVFFPPTNFWKILEKNIPRNYIKYKCCGVFL